MKVLTVLLCACFVTCLPEKRQSETVNYGQKLRPKILGVELSLPKVENGETFHEVRFEVSEESSDDLPPVKRINKRARVPSRIMVRTHKTTTEAPEQPESTLNPSEFLHYYQNPYVSRKPSIPPKKFAVGEKKHHGEIERTTTTRRVKKVTSTTTTTPLPFEEESTTTTPQYTFPPFRTKVPVADNFAESRTIPRTLQTPKIDDPPEPDHTVSPVTPKPIVVTPHQRMLSSRKVSHTTTTTKRVSTTTTTEPVDPTTIPTAASAVAETTFDTTVPVVTSRKPAVTTTTTSKKPTTAVFTTISSSAIPLTVKTTIGLPPKPTPPQGLPLKVITKTFRPIYRLVSNFDAEEPGKAKPELDLVRKLSKPVPTSSSLSEGTATTADLPADEGLTTVLAGDNDETTLEVASTTTPVSVVKKTPAASKSKSPFSSKNGNNKVHYIITVIDPKSGQPTQLGTEEELRKFVETHREADDDGEYVLSPLSPDQLANLRGQENNSADEGSEREEEAEEEEEEPKKEEEDKKYISQNFHFSSSDPVPENEHRFVQPSRHRANNFLQEDKPFHHHHQAVKNDFIVPIPLRTVVSYQPEPSLREGKEAPPFFNSRNVHSFTQLSPTGQVTKIFSPQSLFRHSGPSSSNPHLFDLPPVVQNVKEEVLGVLRSPTQGDIELINRPIPAQSFFVEEKDAGPRVIKQRDVRVESNDRRSFDYSGFRTVPYVVDYVPYTSLRS